MLRIGGGISGTLTALDKIANFTTIICMSYDCIKRTLFLGYSFCKKRLSLIHRMD